MSIDIKLNPCPSCGKEPEFFSAVPNPAAKVVGSDYVASIHCICEHDDEKFTLTKIEVVSMANTAEDADDRVLTAWQSITQQGKPGKCRKDG